VKNHGLKTVQLVQEHYLLQLWGSCETCLCLCRRWLHWPCCRPGLATRPHLESLLPLPQSRAPHGLLESPTRASLLRLGRHTLQDVLCSNGLLLNRVRRRPHFQQGLVQAWQCALVVITSWDTRVCPGCALTRAEGA
jgi:hypothetical protein